MVGRGKRKFGIWNHWFSILYCCFNIKITIKTKFNKYRLGKCIFFYQVRPHLKTTFSDLNQYNKIPKEIRCARKTGITVFTGKNSSMVDFQSEFITLRWNHSRALNFLLLKLDFNVVFKYILGFEAASWQLSKSDFKKIADPEQIFKIFPIIKNHGSKGQMSFPHVAYDICRCPKYKSAS